MTAEQRASWLVCVRRHGRAAMEEFWRRAGMDAREMMRKLGLGDGDAAAGAAAATGPGAPAVGNGSVR